MTVGNMPASRRWPVISALAIVQIFAWGSSYYLLAVFAALIAADTGWPRSWIVSGLSLGLFVAGIASPRVGEAIRHHDAKPALTLSSLLLVSGLLILATAPVLPAFMPGWIVLGIGMGIPVAMAGANAAVVGTLGAALYDPVRTGAIPRAKDFALALVNFVALMTSKCPPWIVELIASIGGAVLVWGA